MRNEIKAYMSWVLACFLALTSQAHAQSSDSKFSLFETAEAAQHHCPFDTVVWLNTKNDTYSLKTPSPAANNGEAGAFMCQREADQMDYKLMQTNQ